MFRWSSVTKGRNYTRNCIAAINKNEAKMVPHFHCCLPKGSLDMKMLATPIWNTPAVNTKEYLVIQVQVIASTCFSACLCLRLFRTPVTPDYTDCATGTFISSTTEFPTSTFLSGAIEAVLAKDSKLKYIVYSHPHWVSQLLLFISQPYPIA